MPEPVKCYKGRSGIIRQERLRSFTDEDGCVHPIPADYFTPGVWLPIGLLERLVEDRFYGAYLADFLGKPLPATTDTEGNTLRGLIRELREEA